MFIKSHLVLIAVLIAAALVVAMIVSRPERPDVAQARGEVIAAQVAAKAALAKADTLLQENKFLKRRADSARAQLVNAHEVSSALEARLRTAKADLALAYTDEDTTDMVASSARVIQYADSLVASRTSELSAALAADSADSRRADEAEAALARLNESCKTLSGASDKLVAKSKPGFFSKLRPSLIIGTVVGVDEHKTPVVAAGVGFGWHF